MGLSTNAISVIHWLKSNGLINMGNAVAELGSQQINNDIIANLNSIDHLAKLFGVAPFSETFDWTINEQKYLESGMQHLPEDAPFAQELYEHLGLKYICVDFDESPHSLKMDLNYDSVPKNHKGKYSLVTNFGTTEHAANQLNAFKIIHDFTTPNGVMLHTLPFQGFPSHGFLTYSMQFFWMLCRSNLYKVIDVNLTFWNSYKVPDNVFQFAKENSAIFANKDHISEQKFQDVGVIIVLQKQHDIEFVPPIDVLDGTKTTDPVMKKRYWTVFDQNSLNMYLLRGKSFLKKFI